VRREIGRLDASGRKASHLSRCTSDVEAAQIVGDWLRAAPLSDKWINPTDQQYDTFILMSTFSRIGILFGSLLLSAILFSLSFIELFRAGASLPIFHVTIVFALPVWCLYLPFVIALKDAEARRIWIILFSGILIGPASLAFWCLILQLRGGDPYTIWHGDPLTGLGGIAAIICALIVGFLTTSLYVLALRVLHRLLTAARG
jgi:hypothetical protein